MGKQLLEIVGKATDGRLVVSGIYRFKETHGLPLDMILESVNSKNLIPSWLHLVREAKDAGINISKFMTELESSVVLVYGKEYWGEIHPYL